MTIELVSCAIHGEFEVDTAPTTIDARLCPWEKGNPSQGRRYVGRGPGRCYGDLEFIRDKRWRRDIGTNTIHDRAAVCEFPNASEVLGKGCTYPEDEEVERKVRIGEWHYCESCHGYPELHREETVPDDVQDSTS